MVLGTRVVVWHPTSRCARFYTPQPTASYTACPSRYSIRLHGTPPPPSLPTHSISLHGTPPPPSLPTHSISLHEAPPPPPPHTPSAFLEPAPPLHSPHTPSALMEHSPTALDTTCLPVLHPPFMDHPPPPAPSPRLPGFCSSQINWLRAQLELSGNSVGANTAIRQKLAQSENEIKRLKHQLVEEQPQEMEHMMMVRPPPLGQRRLVLQPKRSCVRHPFPFEMAPRTAHPPTVPSTVPSTAVNRRQPPSTDRW